MLYLRQLDLRCLADPKYTLRFVDQVSSTPASLSHRELLEAVGLPEGHTVNLYAVDVEEWEERLLTHPALRTAQVQKQLPDTLRINYSLRSPLLRIADRKDIVMDQEGRLFTDCAFGDAHRLPDVYTGLSAEELQPGQFLDVERLGLILRIFAAAQHLALKQVDLSRAFEENVAQRELVLMSGDCLLRLHPEHLEESLRQISHLEIEEYEIVDLRIPEQILLR
jgi:hypothetical protein